MRFVVVSEVDLVTYGRLEQEYGTAELGTKFWLERGLEGMNLAMVAEMVSQAYGVDPETAVEEGHVGATWSRDCEFAVWFHWPTA
jgi:hypothetical protein